MRRQLSQPIEDYIKIIYECTLENERASTNQLAERLQVTAASVTGMLQKLAVATPPLVDYQKHHGVRLTAEGERIALEMVRHHRLIEMFLHQILGYEWDQVHAEAERLEHVISEDFEERIARVLGDPLHDPHGDPIPTRDLRMPASPTLPLAEVKPGQKATIHRVGSANPELLRYLGERGVVPQASLEVLDYSPFDGNMTLQIIGQPGPIVLGARITSAIYVEATPPR